MIKRKDKQYLSKILSNAIHINNLDKLTENCLANDDGWKSVYNKNNIQAFTKKNVFGSGITSIRYRTTLKQKLHVIEEFAYQNMLDYMPLWSKEFIKGECLASYKDYKLLKTQFKTPFFLKNRSYVFVLLRIKTADTLKVIYLSVGDAEYLQTDKGFVRSKLYPTVYKFTKLNDTEVQMQHILSTDLGQDLPLWFQNAFPVTNGYVQANIRDCEHIVRVLENWEA